MSRPIPLSFLCHKADLLVPCQTDDPLDREFDEKQLSHVRIQLEDKVRLSGNNAASVSAAVLYYDCTNSLPHGVSFATDMELRFAGKIYRIAQAEQVLDRSRPHHWKVVLA